MNKKYIEVLNNVVDEQTSNPKEREKLKKILEQIIEAEKGYEFNEERPRIKTLLETIIS